MLNLGGAVARVLAVLLVMGGAIAPAPARGGERPFGDIAAVRYARPGEEIVLKIGDDAVPAAVLAEFLARYTTKSVEDFVERELAVHDVLSRGRADGWPDELRRRVRLMYLYGLGEKFFDEGSRDVIHVSADELRSTLPGRLVRGSFELLAFASEAEARKALESIRTAGEFDEFAKKHPEKRKSVTELSPASGFFHPFDDAGLFNRGDGEVAGYVETGIGSALVLVRSIRKMSESEIAREVDAIREQLFSNKRGEYFRQARQRHPLSLDMKAIRDFSGRELRKEIAPGMDSDFCGVGGTSVKFGDFAALLDTPLSKNLKVGEADQLADLYAKACEKAGQNVSDGLTAIENGHLALNEQWEKWFDERKRRLYYLQGITDFLGDGWAPGDKDARKHYEKQRSTKYDVPESVRALYIFVTAESRAKEILGRMKKGESFERLAEQYSEFDKHGHAKGARVMRISQGSDIHRSIQDGIFGKRLKPGDVTDAIRTPVGYHIFKIVESAPAKIVPFKEVAGRIKTALTVERFEEGRKNYVKELRKKYAVVKFDDALKAVESRTRGEKGKAPGDPGTKAETPARPHDPPRKAGRH